MKKIKHLLVCLVLILCSLVVSTGCDNSHSHTHTYSSEWTTDENYHWNSSTCGCDDEITNKALHSWDDGVVVISATCEAEGEKIFTCTSCQKTKKVAIPVSEHSYSEEWESNEDFHWHEATCIHTDLASGLGAHSWNEGVITTPSTCTTEGVKTFTCTVCEKTKTEAVPLAQHTYSNEWTSDENEHWHASTCGCEGLKSDKATHSWNEGVITTPSTCTTEGVKTFTCTACGKTKTEAVPLAQHTYSNEWTSDENEHWHVSTCGCEGLTKDKNTHSWNEGVITTPATCTVEGVKTFTCIICEKTKTEAVPTVQHTYSTEWSSNASEHWHALTCGCIAELKDKAEHTWDGGVITTPATCTAEGVKTYTCTVCEKTKTEAVPTLQHTYSTEWSSDENEHWHAATCGCDSLTKDKNTHSWNEGVITTPATCTAEGVKTYTCTVCEKTKTEAVPTLQHTYSTEWSSDENEHWHASTCGCDNLTKDKNTHSWNEGVITTPATCTAEGVKTYTCTVCEKIKTEAVPTLQHTYSTEWSSDENEHWHASTCGCDSLTKDKNTHSWNEGVITTPATCTAEGVKTYTCMVCEKNKTETIAVTEHSYENGVCNNCGIERYSEGLEYTLDKYGSYYTVTGIGTCTDTEILIPTTYNDKPVKAIGSFAFYDNNKAWKVIIPSSVTTIEYSAFEGSSVVAVVVGENVTTIQSNAFSGEKLIEIHNKSNCSITSDMYRNTPLNIYSSSGTSKVFESDGFIFYESGNTCYLVGYCGEKTALTLPPNCNSKQYSIYQWAFYADQDITSITISSGVKSIGEDAFRSCNNLETVIFEEGITKIEDYAFVYCSGIKEIILPESLTTIGVGVFQGCSSMKTLYFGKNVSTIGKWLIWGGTDSLDTLLVHQDNLTFYSKQNCVIVEETGTIILGCKNSVIPTLARVQTIGEFAFVGCTIESITIPSNITLIDYAAFQSCEQLKEITFSEGLTTIGNYAFHGCKSLVSVDLPDTLTWIGLSFDHCSSLTSITFGANQTWTGAFSYCDSLEEVTIPATIQSISSSAFEFCKNLKKVNIASGVTTIASEAFYYCTSLVSITLPDSVETIGADAFSNCTSLKTIKFSKNLKEIGEDAFYKCSALTGVTLPSKLQKIGRYAFYNCTSITSLTIPNSVTTISEYAFSGCSALTTVTIGSGVNYIGGYAFSNTGLTSATFYYTSGWWGATTSSATSGTSFTFSTASEAAKLLKTTYLRYYWHRG